MFKCRFCGREYKDRRSIHGHLMTSHREEYYQNGCDDSAMIEEGEVMAVRHKTYPVYGLQFHPESILTPDGKTIVRNFLNQI